jgi:hypothetical protein
MFTEQMIERTAVMGLIPSSNHAANTDTSVAGINMNVIRRLLTYLDVGALGVNSNIQMYYQASATANMASPSNVAASIPITAATANRVYLLEVRADQLPAGTSYVQPVIVVNANASFCGVVVVGDECAYKPGSNLTIANTVGAKVAT